MASLAQGIRRLTVARATDNGHKEDEREERMVWLPRMTLVEENSIQPRSRRKAGLSWNMREGKNVWMNFSREEARRKG